MLATLQSGDCNKDKIIKKIFYPAGRILQGIRAVETRKAYMVFWPNKSDTGNGG